MDPQQTIFRRLMEVIEQRKAAPSEKSYTNKLLDGGVTKIGAKITEEAAETVEAAGEPGLAGQEHLAREAADLIYHLFVLLSHRDVPLEQVEAVLAGRFGIGGLEEKASRPKKVNSTDGSAVHDAASKFMPDPELYRVCGILESIGATFPPESAEALAIRDAASAFIQVFLHEGLKHAYAKLRAAIDGHLTEEMKADLRRHGIDPDSLDAEVGEE